MCTLHLWILTSKFVYWSFNYLKNNLQHITTIKLCLDMIYSFWRLEKLVKCRSKYFHLFISSFQSLSCVWLFVTPWTAAFQASLTITNSYIVFKLMSIALVKPSNQLILCCPLLPMPSSFPASESFPIELVIHIRWPQYWSFSFSISPSNEYSGLISFRMTGWISLQFKVLSRVFNTTVQQHPFFSA